MPESANPVLQHQTIIEIRPHRGGWKCFEGPGVEPYWTGESAKDDAIGYAKARAKFEHGEIRVLSSDGSVEKLIKFDHANNSPDDQTPAGRKSGTIMGSFETKTIV